MAAIKFIFFAVLLISVTTQYAYCEDEVESPAAAVSTDDLPLPEIQEGPSGGEGQNCKKFGLGIPATICSKWCVIPSPLGSCGGGLKCCVIVV